MLSFAYHEKRDDETEADFVARLAADLDAEFRRLGPENAFVRCCKAGRGGAGLRQQLAKLPIIGSRLGGRNTGTSPGKVVRQTSRRKGIKIAPATWAAGA